MLGEAAWEVSMSGFFVWRELVTTDPVAARKFYADVIGWSSSPAQGAPMPYWLMGAQSEHVAGIMQTMPQAPQPGWCGYVGVDDVDATASKAMSLGAKMIAPPSDIPNVGRFAVFNDPQGAVMGLMKWSFTPPAPKLKPGDAGLFAWNELYTTDAEKALAFYGALFGWKEDHVFDMGPMGKYRIFANEGRQIGGMMNRPPQMPVSAWTYYARVDEINAAIARVKAGGGQIINGPMEVPGDDMVAQGIDPQGAHFAIVAKKG
jgi:predicted enzyme related to lactoylglutathione lyase